MMEKLNEKSLDRVVSQKALQMGNSFPCQICVLGFFCGVCLATLFLAAITIFAFGQTPFSYVSMGVSTMNSNPRKLNMVTSRAFESDKNETGRKIQLLKHNEKSIEEKEYLLYSAWTTLVDEPNLSETEFLEKVGLSKFQMPKAPHLETCKKRANIYKRMDNPNLTIRKQLLDIDSLSTRDEQVMYLMHQGSSEGYYPPWITGSDEENYPMTRKVQHDIWIHQHPFNCSDPNIKFLVADWERPSGFGVGAQIAEMCGLLAIAINEKRVLVTNYYNRADHDGCKGSSRAHWSCYFLLETSQECRDRAVDLLGRQEAMDKGIVTSKDSYSSKKIWTEPTPRIWGKPWSYLQPTTEINGSLVMSHRKMDRRWWRAQAVRYLMRFQTKYTCDLLNAARHAAFGPEAAKMVVATLAGKWPQDIQENAVSGIEEFVWSNHKPWIPSPLLSMHVRMGDKACEMKVVQFEDYMVLAERIRKRFPQLSSIWLSTEMQEVIEKSKLYPSWNFYYTNVTRQVGNMTMATYEASLGRETSTNYPLVNFIMATESNFFVGALGSTWCFLIDGMRNTGGKVMSGYLSVNKDRFW